MSQWVIHRSSRYFPDPEARWADGLAKRLPKYAYFLFGGGPRICIGGGFAMMEGVLLLAASIALYPSLTLQPAYGVRLPTDRPREAHPLPALHETMILATPHRRP